VGCGQENKLKNGEKEGSRGPCVGGADLDKARRTKVRRRRVRWSASPRSPVAVRFFKWRDISKRGSRKQLAGQGGGGGQGRILVAWQGGGKKKLGWCTPVAMPRGTEMGGKVKSTFLPKSNHRLVRGERGRKIERALVPSLRREL